MIEISRCQAIGIAACPKDRRGEGRIVFCALHRRAKPYQRVISITRNPALVTGTRLLVKISHWRIAPSFDGAYRPRDAVSGAEYTL